MRLLAAYDIADPRRLFRVAQAMEDHGARVQLSVFELDITPGKLEQLQSRVLSILDINVDGVKYYPLCESCAQQVVVLGRTAKGWETADYVVL